MPRSNEGVVSCGSAATPRTGKGAARCWSASLRRAGQRGSAAGSPSSRRSGELAGSPARWTNGYGALGPSTASRKKARWVQMIVPCKYRMHFNYLVMDKFEMVTCKNLPYTIYVEKKTAKTVLKGEWSMFARVHGLSQQDSIVLQFVPAMRGFSCIPFARSRMEKLPPYADDLQGLTLMRCTYTKRVADLSTAEKKRLVVKLRQLHRPSLRPLIHKLTATNVDRVELKLPRRMAEMLRLEFEDSIMVRYAGAKGLYDISCRVLTDGRAVCSWGEIVEAYDLHIGDMMILVPAFDVEDEEVMMWVDKV